MSKLKSHLSCLVDPATPEEAKLKAAQEVSENLENIVNSQHYSSFLETAIPIFLQLLKEGEPQFLADSTAQQVRKLVLDLIHRLPTNDQLKGHVKLLLSAMFSLLEIENEENVLVCLKVIIELHKQFRPSYSPEINKFMIFVKTIYTELPKTMTNALEPSEGEPQIGDSSETTKNPAVLPKASSSLKVLAELPIIVVLMYQLYKQTVHQWVAELIPLSIKTIILQPSDKARQSVNFNKEIYVDFVAVQIKFLSFLAYIIRVYQDQVNTYAHNVVQGMLALLKNCPQEVAHLRRELLIAARHILATDLRNRFVSCIDQLFDEDLLIGCGWTTRETVRSLAYSILADLVHHIRANLTIGQLSQAVHLFSKNVHDDTLPVSIQTMSCKLLLNLVECIRQKGESDPSARDILMRMMEVFILKFQSIAEYQIPEIMERCQSSNELAVLQDMSPNGSQPPGVGGGIGGAAGGEKEGARKMSLSSNNIASFSFSSIFSSGTGVTGSAASTYISVADCRGMVKTLVCGMKTITWGAKLPTPSSDFTASQKLFFPRETEVFVKLLKYGLIALDIYRVTVLSTGAHSLRNSNCQTVKTKEEKEVLEYFAGVYTMLSTSMFQEVFTDMVEYVVERVQSNYALQIIPNSFLANASTSAAFAGILLNFLLKHMDELGTTSDLSNLYLKMFKLVFGSVTLFAQENELMLKPHLHEIVNNSMQMAHIAREPCNYFLLLRALFRSIGGGSHELLYQEFLPLLSNLLQGLNRLQSAHHKQYMKDLFVELCLTVPVRLSSLLPYLHLLMDPLVSALNGSQTLVSQGLRTLELCVDNLQPDFLYEHIQPVRAQLMQALWQTLHNSDDSIAQVAFRVLGKFGGSNRKMLTSPQKLEYRETLIEGPCVSINFPDTESPVDLPVAKAIEIAVKMVKPSHSVEPYYRQQAWQLLQAYLVSALNLSDADSDLYQLLKQVHFQPSEFSASRLKHISLPQCSNKVARTTFETALHGVFIASCLRELRNDAVVFLAGVVRLVTAIAVVQQCSTTNFLKQLSNDTMDVYVLLDAIAKCVSAEEKELCRIAELALTFMVDSACTIVGDKDKSSELPLFEVAADKLCGCCYERAWYTKSGGCWAIGFFMDKMPLKWVINHQLTFLMALLFVLHDLSEEVSSGTVLQAQKLIQQLITICNSPPDENKTVIEPLQAKAFHSVTRHLTKEVISPNENVRKQTHSCFQLLSEVTGKSLSSIIEPHKELLVDMIPPRKHLLKHQPINTQIALMDGYTFCSDLSPRLFSVNLAIQEHKIFFQELIALCEGEETTLIKLPCYKSVQSLIPLKTSGLAALAACHYLTDMRERIFSVLYKAINSSAVQLQNAGKEAMKKFMADHSQSDIELVHSALRPLLMMLGDFRNLNPSLLTKLTHMVELFPTSFNEKMCESLLGHLRRWVDVLLQTAQTKLNRRGEEVTVCLLIMGMFHMLPASTFRLFEHLLAVCIKAEKAVNTELGSPFRDPLLKFALKFPSQTVDYFLCRLSDPIISRVFRHFLKHKDGVPLKEVLESNSQKLLKATFGLQVQPVPGTEEAIVQKKQELQYQGISLCYLLVESNEQWINDKTVVIDHLRKIWIQDSFHTQMSRDSLPLSHWQECVMLLKCLLAYCKSHHEDIILLFQLLRAFLTRHTTSFPFLKSYLENDIAKNYTISEKRQVFFKFVDIFPNPDYQQELKAKILQFVLIPMFTTSFEDERGDELLGGPPDPEHDSDSNIISVFINRVINPDKPFGGTDSVTILLLQFSSLLVEHAAPHIHDSNNKKQGAKLRRLMTFAWPCLLPKQCVDPATKYHGHLLLAHIIAKFAIHKRIVLQVFHSLLKAHAIEARSIVRQALEILTPVVPIRMEDANATLVHWTKKIIVEEGHTVAQLVHMLQLLCRHYRVYYPVRQHLVQHMVSSMQRLGLTSSATIEQRRLAVDLAEVIIKWEFQRAREAQEMEGDTMDHDRIMQDTSATALGMKRSVSDGTVAAPGATGVGGDSKRQRPQPQVADPTWPLDKQYADAVVNFLIRLACQVNDSQSTSIPGSPPSPGEALAKRCVTLVRTALKPDLWPYIEVKVAWFGKLFETLSQVDPSTGNGVSVHASACTALEILTFLLISLPRPVILAGFKSLSRGLQLCMTCNNTKVLRYLHALLTRLMSMFPSEPASAMRSSKQEELEALYSSIPRIAAEGLTNYEKATNPSTTNLQCTIMILKAACNNDPTYIDRFLVLFVKVIQKLHKEHLTTSPETHTISELLQLSLDMCKLRVSMMPQDCRKMFFSVISSLIEKSPDAKLLKTITKIVDDWIKNRHDYPSHSGPSLREKTVLLSRMMAFYEKRFPEDLELNTIFLDIVHFVYRDEQLSATELTAKLEPAFLSGLRCPHIQIRNKFFEVFDASIQPRLFDRLLYIMCSQNWEHCGGHYWIKQCIELLLMVGMIDGPVRASTSSPLLPSITSIGPASTPLAPDVTEPPAITSQPPEELMEGMEGDSGEGGGVRALEKVANKLNVFLNECRNIQTRQFVTALSQLCHDNTQLAHIVWVDMLPKLWSALSERQRHALSGEVSPFLCSAAHLMQMECHPSAIGTFLEAALRCRPIPEIRSCLLKYLGKTHNYWHGVTLLLEERAASEGELSLMLKEPPAYDGDYTDEILDPLKHETLDSLSELYSMLNEDDMWAGLWTLRCRFPETVTAISFELQGVYEQAQESYEQVMKKARELHNVGPAPPSVIPEYKLWEEHWCKCARELGQWDTLTEFGKAHAGTNPFLVLENAWRVQDWTAMKEASTQAEPICTERYSAKLNLLRGFLALCYPDEQRLSAVEKLVEAASIQSVKHWRRLPSIVSHAHIPLLQLSQQIIELQEATQIQSGLQGGGLSRQGFQNEVKTIFKTWRNRLPNHFDDLSYWSDVFLWREHHFKCIVKAFDGSSHHGDQSNQSLLAVHNLASGITQFASIARKQKLVSVSLDSLSRIHSIPSVPVVDLFQKIRQQVKCYLMTSSVMEPAELQEALDFIESTNLKFFTKEMVSEFMALKGAFLAQTGRSEEANKNFSAAVQLQDSLVKAWSLWGDFLEQLFTADRNITLGVAALTCFLHACRQQNEPKSRKYLAKTIWMLSYDDEKGTLAEALDKYYIGIPPLHWLPWIPQLLNCLIRNEGTHILNLLCSVGKAFPQAVYFPIRTLYLTLKMEQREKYKAEGLLSRSNSQTAPAKPSATTSTANEGVEPMQVDSTNQPAAAETASNEKTASGSGTKSEGQSTQQSGKAAGTPQGDGPAESAPIRASASLWRCSRIMHLLRDLHPTLLSALEGIVDQLIWFRESWYEDLLRQLNEGLALCYQVSFKNRTDVASTRITPELQQYVQKLVNSFGVSLEQSNSGGTLSQEALSKRAQIAAQDPTFQRLKAQFSGDFELSSPGPKRLNSLIAKLKRWIKILEMKTKSLYRSFLLEDRCRFLSNFSLSTADVEMPGEYLEPLPMPYYVRIARFMPRVEIVQKNSTNVRRLCIQGDNGKIYPYLVLNDATTASECRKEERVLQLFRLINHCLKKDKETCKRHLMFTLPKVVALSPQMRLAEDDVSAISLHDIFKQYTNEQGMEHDLIIIQFYERLGQLQSRGDKISLSTLKLMFTQLQQYFAPPTILRNWCERTCSSLTDFWTMRRQMMRQLALCGLAEYVFHLTRLDPEMLQVARNYGCLTQTFYRFEINSKGALDANRPVPFRLTPSLQTLFSPVGTRGPIQMSMIAITRCLVLPQFSLESLLLALLKDEFLLWCKQEQEESEGSMVSSADVNNEAVIQRVTAAVEAITTRLYNLAEFETGQSQVSTIISAAASLDNICRMDPAWNPWL